jgi:hypothetical protein
MDMKGSKQVKAWVLAIVALTTALSTAWAGKFYAKALGSVQFFATYRAGVAGERVTICGESLVKQGVRNVSNNVPTIVYMPTALPVGTEFTVGIGSTTACYVNNVASEYSQFTY